MNTFHLSGTHHEVETIRGNSMRILAISLIVLMTACSEGEHSQSSSDQARTGDANNKLPKSDVVLALSNAIAEPAAIVQTPSMLPAVVPSEYAGANVAFVQFDAQSKFLINSTLSNNQSVFALDNAHWLLPTKVGPILLDEKTDLLQFTRITPEDTQYFMFDSLAKAKDKFFVGSRRNGIFILDPRTLTYESNFQIGEIDSFGKGHNLELTQETNEADIWTSTFNELHKYDQNDAKWVNLNHIFGDLAVGKGSSHHVVFVDSPYVWVGAAAHKDSKGGLFQFDQRTGSWKVYRRELLTTGEEPVRIDTFNFISSPRALWMYLYQGNSYNFYLAYYDKQTDKWQSFHRAEIVQAVERLIEDLPNCRWIQKRPILTQLEKVINSPTENGHPYSYTETESASLKASFAKLKDAFDKVDPNTEKIRGFPLYTAQHGWLLKGQTYSPNVPVHKLGFEPLTYKSLITSLGERVIVDTDIGLGILDVAHLRFELFQPPVSLSQPTSWEISKDNSYFSLCEYFEGDDGPDVTHTYKFDLNSMKVIMDTMVENNRCPSSDQVQPTTLQLPSLGAIELVWDGLLLRDKKDGNLNGANGLTKD